MNNSMTYVEEAHEVIKRLNSKHSKGIVTTTQLRKFLSMLIAIHEKEQVIIAKEISAGKKDDKLSQEIMDELQVLKVRLVYQCGREKKVKQFEEEAGLLKRIDAIKDSKKAFEDFFNYVEALVAYHKFEGGSD